MLAHQRKLPLSVLRLIGAPALLVAVACLFDQRDPRAARGDDVANVILSPATPDKPMTVRDRLIAGLQARLQSEVGFIDHVLVDVQAGLIPQSMVDETFLWARKKAGNTRYGRPQRPIIYFQPAMIARANALHVTL